MASQCLKFMFAAAIVILTFVLGPNPSDAGEVEVNGFFFSHWTGRIDRASTGTGRDFIVGEERLRLDLESWSESIDAGLQVRVDVRHDALAGEAELVVREAFLDWTLGPLDMRLGRQIITWGKADLLFINDVYPKDWAAFFSGMPLAYLKLGSDSLKVRLTTRVLNIETTVTPRPTFDVLPTPPAFTVTLPLPEQVSLEPPLSPQLALKNSEVGIRLGRRLGGGDLAVYGWRGFRHQPSVRLEPMTPENGLRATQFYPRLDVLGISYQGAALGGIITIETGYYYSPNDRAGRDPFVPNDDIRFLAGFSHRLGDNLLVGVQYYGETIVKYDAYRDGLPAGFAPAPRYRDFLTMSLDFQLFHQTLFGRIFAYWGRAEADAYLLGSVTWKVSDDLGLTMGFNVFMADDAIDYFGPFAANDNVFIRLRYDFAL